MKLSRHLLIATLAAVLTSAGLLAEERPLNIQFVRPLGMGGAFTAVADDHNIFTYNPAGMVQRTGAEVTILEIAPGVSQDTIDAYNFIKDNQDDLTHWDKLTPARQAQLTNDISDTVSKLDPRVYLAADVASFVSGPKFFGFPVHGGFGAFAGVDGTFNLDPGVIVPNISYSINADMVIPFALAKRWNAPFRMPGKLGVGATAKFIRRGQIKRDRLSILQLDNLDAPPVTLGKGFGGDLGFLYQPTNRVNVGLMIEDFGGTKIKYQETDAKEGYPAVPSYNAVIRPRTNVGVALVPQKLLWLLPSYERWTFSADINDIRAKNEHLLFQDGLRKPLGENLYTHLHLGAEFRYWFLRFRGGANQGYPCFGLGVDIPFIKIDYAYYSRELGVHAGDRQEKNHVVSLALRFGSGNVEARERIKNAKEERKQRNMAVPAEATEVAPTTATPSTTASDKATPTETPAATPAKVEPAKAGPAKAGPAKAEPAGEEMPR